SGSLVLGTRGEATATQPDSNSTVQSSAVTSPNLEDSTKQVKHGKHGNPDKTADEIRSEMKLKESLTIEERQVLIEKGEMSNMIPGEVDAADKLAQLWLELSGETVGNSDPFLEFLYANGVPSMYGPGGVQIRSSHFTDQYSYDRIVCVMAWA